MDDPAAESSFVNHPLWSRFLRWCTIRPKDVQRPRSTNLVLEARDNSAHLESLDDYEYTPLPDPTTYIRLAELLPGNFDDDIRVKIQHHILRLPSDGRIDKRLNLGAIRRDLPLEWDAYQTIVDGKYLFRNKETGHVQWEHPDPGFHTEKYEVPPRNDGIVPRYETVSYVWGGHRKSAIIGVEGPRGPTKLHVTQSLATVLRYLRRPEEARELWIDAICLNQTDYTELSRQVPRMHDIYKLAYKGTAWLGKEDPMSTQALATLRYFGEQIVAEAGTGLLFQSPSAEKGDWFDPDFQLPYTQDTWDQIRILLQRPWFNRLWVVQEIQPGAVVQCGHDTVPIAIFTEAIYGLYSKAQLPDGIRRHLEQATGTLARLPGLCFTRLLYRASTFKGCQDPRDKIYGLLGLAPRRIANSIPVNYEESNAAADVYATVFINHAQITQRLEHFHNCFLGGDTTRHAPSWVPDWYSDIPGETYIPAQFVTNTSRAHYSFSDAKDVFRVLGVRCGQVSLVTEALPPRLDSWEAIRHVRQWEPEDLDTSRYEPTGESLRNAYAITLICHALQEREPDWILTSANEWVQQEWDEALFGRNARSLATSGTPASSVVRRDVADALQCCGARMFFRTYEGYIGLAPADTRMGDVVAIFLGCGTPLILRPTGDGPDHFSVVGECFVYGLHDAIPLLGPLPEPWSGIAAWVEGDRRCLRFLNMKTQEVTKEDPRLTPLVGWERIEKEIDGDDPTLYDFFQHKETGDVINYDPRLEPEKLEASGVKLDWFSLI